MPIIGNCTFVIDQLLAQCAILCVTPRCLVGSLWEVYSLDNSVSQKFYEDEASRSRDIQVRHKSILVSNIKLFLCNSMLNPGADPGFIKGGGGLTQGTNLLGACWN